MWLKKFTLILTVSALSLVFAAGCTKNTDIPEFFAKKGADTVTVYVLTRYELTEIEVNYNKYSSWTELLDGEFDGSTRERSEVVWRGAYVVSVGNLRPGDPGGITLYLNGVYSPYFVKNCEYSAGYTLAFVEPGATLK